MKTSGINSGLTSPLANKVMETTNIELIKLAKCLSIPNFNCICKDELKDLLKQGLGHQGL